VSNEDEEIDESNHDQMKLDQAEAKELEKLIETKHANFSKIS
jgi:hypothetical protein